MAILGVERVEGGTELCQVVRRLRASSSLAHFLNGGKKDPDQNSDDRYHYEQLDEREAGAFARGFA